MDFMYRYTAEILQDAEVRGRAGRGGGAVGGGARLVGLLLERARGAETLLLLECLAKRRGRAAALRNPLQIGLHAE